MTSNRGRVQASTSRHIVAVLFALFAITVLFAGAALVAARTELPMQSAPPAGGTPSSVPTSTPTSEPTCGPDWSVVAVPTVGPGDNELLAVATLAGDDVWAVGGYNDGTQEQSLALHWDGTSWASIAVPNYGGANNYLTAIAAVAPDDVWAIGSYFDVPSYNFLGLVEHWNGSEWAASAPFDLSAAHVYLRAITAISASDIWVIGDLDQAQTLALHWDGTVWQRFETPNVGSLYNRLRGVTANAGDDVWAVGDYSNNPGQHALILHWDGTTWDMVSNPGMPGSIQLLNNVSAGSTNDVWAVGYYCTSSPCVTGISQTLAIHWDGTQWSYVDTPGFPFSASFMGVSVVSASEIWAVGSASGLNPQQLIEQWDGSQWSIAHTLGHPPSGELLSVRPVTSDDIWTVGSSYMPSNGSFSALVEHFVACPPITPSVTPALTETASPSPTSTATAQPTGTLTGTPTATACMLQFSDVPSGSTFYPYIHCLACMGIIDGYADGTFRPSNMITRGQLSKIVSNAAGFSEIETEQLFQDVPPGSIFFQYIERLAGRDFISGYACGQVEGEPCLGGLPYFRPSASASRGQIAKIVSNSARYDDVPGSQIFDDVAPNSTFYDFVQRLASRGFINGYPCGGLGEPCHAGNLPYYRPGNTASRGQVSKVVSNTFLPDCRLALRK